MSISSDELVKQASISGFSAMIASITMYPFYKTKTEMMKKGSTMGITKTFIHLVKNQGVIMMYRGCIPMTMGIIPDKAIKLTTNYAIRRILGAPSKGVNFKIEIIAATGTALTQSIICTPFEMISTAAQSQNKMEARKQSQLNIASKLFRNNLKLQSGLYTGLSATLIRDLPFNIIFFCGMRYTKDFLENNSQFFRDHSVINQFIASLTTGTFAAVVDSPADSIRTRMQLAMANELSTGNQRPAWAKTLIGTAKNMYKEEGIAPFCRLMTIRGVTIGPLFGITLGCTEALRILFSSNIE